MTIAERVDHILQERKMSRRQLAKLAGIPPSSLQSAMERGRNLSIEMIQKLSLALGVNIEDLLGLSQEERDKVKETASLLQYAGQGTEEAHQAAIRNNQRERLLRSIEETTQKAVSEFNKQDLEEMLLEAFRDLPPLVQGLVVCQVCEQAHPYMGAFRQAAKEKMEGLPQRPRATISTKPPEKPDEE